MTTIEQLCSLSADDIHTKLDGMFDNAHDYYEFLFDRLSTVVRYEASILQYNKVLKSEHSKEEMEEADRQRHITHNAVIDAMRMLNRLCAKLELPPLVEPEYTEQDALRRMCALSSFEILENAMRYLP